MRHVSCIEATCFPHESQDLPRPERSSSESPNLVDFCKCSYHAITTLSYWTASELMKGSHRSKHETAFPVTVLSRSLPFTGAEETALKRHLSFCCRATFQLSPSAVPLRTCWDKLAEKPSIKAAKNFLVFWRVSRRGGIK